MSKKAKRYDEGGDIETETTQGQNKSIGDDVRARAMAAMEKGSSEEPTPAPKKAAPKAVAKATPKAEVAETKAKSSEDDKSFWKGTKGYKLADVGNAIKSAVTPAPKDPNEAPSFLKGTKGYKFSDIGNAIKKAVSKPSKVSTDASDAYKKGGSVKATASRRGDGIAQRGRTKGRMV